MSKILKGSVHPLKQKMFEGDFPNFNEKLDITESTTPRWKSSAGSKKGNKLLEAEYIKNLQQQIYLLDLETRHL